ncbi:hypothetical protein LWC33_17545 [Pseudonocardia sp. RS11V-5]|uniref:hypothetical protein n=1 Tax=Pseudonocardia terrae TaxID=2905831 RepID=UPI001E3BFC2B|nr:hypothetical protein [Pseudonocardia terrae]MCE3553255.1 hypothetical protein [Pseudonocardia terrae]
MAPTADQDATGPGATAERARAAAAPPGRARALVRRTVLSRHHWGSEEHLAQAIYGTVIGAAGIAVGSAHGDLREIVLTVVVTVAVYWAAERYADVLAAAVHAEGRWERVRGALRRGLPVVEAGLSPLVVLVVLALLTGRLALAVFVALGLATLMLGGFGHAAARRAGATRFAAFGWGLCSAALGGLVIGLKMLLH